MTYEQIVAMMQTYYSSADAAMVNGHYAVQVNVIGEGEGAFYIEIADGKVKVQPYDYVDRNACLNVTAEVLSAIVKGNLTYREAVQNDHMTVDGDAQVSAVLDSICLLKEDTVEAVIDRTEKKPVKDNNISTAKKAHVRKRALKKSASNVKNSKKAK